MNAHEELGQPETSLDASAVPAAETATEGPRIQDTDPFRKRQQRIDEHYRKSLAHEDPLISILGTEAADLMTLQLQVAEALREALGTARLDPEDLDRNRGGIELMLKLGKQVSQYTQLHQKLIKNAEPPAHA